MSVDASWRYLLDQNGTWVEENGAQSGGTVELVGVGSSGLDSVWINLHCDDGAILTGQYRSYHNPRHLVFVTASGASIYYNPDVP